MKQKFITYGALICLIGLFVASFPGCAQTPAGKVVQAERVVVTSVDVGMQQWAVYVKAGKATQEQVDQVKVYYGIYYMAQLTAKAALEKWVSSGTVNDATGAAQAQVSVQQAEAQILALLNQYLQGGK